MSRLLTENYAAAARAAGHEVRLVHLHDLQFDSDFGLGGYHQSKPLEPDLEQFLQDLAWCEHWVLATPMWWGGLPVKLKGLFDRALLPGRAFDTRRKRYGLPLPMLAGRSARVIVTSDTPGWFLRLAYHNALIWQLRRQVLGFIGFKPTRFMQCAPASEPQPGMVDRWVKQARHLGAAAS